MLLRVSLSQYVERSRLAIWAVVIVSLVMSFLLVWQSVVREANQSAMLLATQQVVARANYFKQQWLLAGQKTPLIIEGHRLNYTSMGWVKPINDSHQVDCQVWLDTLYPQHQVLGQQVVAIKSETMADGYLCRYKYAEDRFIVIILIDNHFIARSGFSTQ